MGAGAPTDMFYIQTTTIVAGFWPSLGSEIVTENCGGPQIHYETSAKRRLRTADHIEPEAPSAFWLTFRKFGPSERLLCGARVLRPLKALISEL